MLTDFLKTSVEIQRQTSSIFNGTIVASLTFTELPDDSFLKVIVTGATLVSFLATGIYDGAAVSETIAIAGEDSNRGFQLFSSLSTITCSGVLNGTAEIKLLSESSEAVEFTEVVGTYLSDKSYRAENDSLEPFGDRDAVPRNYKFYFQPTVDVREQDLIIEGSDRYRVQDVVGLASLTGSNSHLEVTVLKEENT